MKNLENLGVLELSAQESKEVEGGWGWLVPVALYVMAEWDDISAGFNDGINGNDYNYQPCP